MKLLQLLTQLLFPYQLINFIRRIMVKLHTLWISNQFKSIGDNCIIDFPIKVLGGDSIEIGNACGIGSGAVITAWSFHNGKRYTPSIKIGHNASIGEDCHITSINKIEIGNNVLMGKKVTITDNSHGQVTAEELDQPPIQRVVFSKGPVTIEDNVWIGDKATILANVRIGANSIVGANSVVTKSVPGNCVVGGNPARITKILRSPEEN